VWTDTQTPPKTIPTDSMCAGKDVKVSVNNKFNSIFVEMSNAEDVQWLQLGIYFSESTRQRTPDVSL